MLTQSREELIAILQNGGVAIIATDTIYGMVGQATKKETYERIFSLKIRKEGSPFIILIKDLSSLSDFGVVLSKTDQDLIEKNYTE